MDQVVTLQTLTITVQKLLYPSPQVYDDPCIFASILQADQNFTSKFKKLTDNNVISDIVENGYMVNNRNSNNYISLKGNLTSHSIEWVIPANTKVDGFLHCHNSNSNNVFTVTSNVFSDDDIILMARTFMKGFAADTTNLFMGVTSQNDNPYLLKVTNIAKFRAFATSIVGENGDDIIKIKTFRDNYKKIFKSDFPQNSQTYLVDNEKAILKLIKDMVGGDGLTLFSGSYDCSQWSKLKLSSNNDITPLDCKY